MSKRILVNLEQAEKALDALEEHMRESDLVGDGFVSTDEFVRLNMDRLKRFGLARKHVYNFLIKTGVKLGSYESFARAWRKYPKKQEMTQENKQEESR